MPMPIAAALHNDDIDINIDNDNDKTTTTLQLHSTSTKRETDININISISNNKPPPWWILPCITAAQFAGTSLWFAGNAVLAELVDELHLPSSSLSLLTSSVQLGFIVGCLLFALTSMSDRFPPTRVFMTCSFLGATMNAMIPWVADALPGLMILRFLTGVLLAGIYPVGMKIASDWYATTGLGQALGWLVGALSLGTAVPFLLQQIPGSWEWLLWETSLLAVTGGVVVGCLVPNGPHRTPASKMDPSVVWKIFQDPDLAAAACGYFGHMWEIYAFWTWCPVVWEAYLKAKNTTNQPTWWDPSLITFAIIAAGNVGCVLGGIASQKYGSANVAFLALSISGLLCLLSPLLYLLPPPFTLTCYIVWGMAAAGDSPQFSSLVAQTAPPSSKGTALTMVNCVGFSITILSIQLLGVPLDPQYLFCLLAPGPLFGLWSMKHLVFSQSDRNDPKTDEER